MNSLRRGWENDSPAGGLVYATVKQSRAVRGVRVKIRLDADAGMRT